MTEYYLSVDIGGTSIRLGLLNEKGEILKRHALSSDSVREPESLVPILLKLIELAIQDIHPELPRGLALGIPGLVEQANGIVLASPHFPKWSSLPVLRPLQDVLPFPVCIDNDANQAALGEAWKGAGKNGEDFVMMTLGTGIGGGIIYNGQLFRGSFGFAGEIGHMVIDRHHLKGALASEGTLESLASQSGLCLHLKDRHQSGTIFDLEIQCLDPDSRELPRYLLNLAQQNNAEALRIWQDLGHALGCGITSLVHVLGIFRFVIGGGLLGAWDFFAPACIDETRRRIYPVTRDRLEIIQGELGNDAGLIGGVRAIQLTFAQKSFNE